jgi:hypothetical protein
MGVVSFTYRKPPKSIGGFAIDAFISEHYSFSNSVTDIPIEDGSTIADHVIENADEIQVKAFIGKTEFTVWEGPLPQSTADIAPADPKARIRAAYYELLRLKRSRQTVDVVMGLGTFHDMVITSFDIDRDVENGADLPFDMSFKRIKKVKSQTTTISAFASKPVMDQAAGSANMGTGATKKVDPNDWTKKEWKYAVEVLHSATKEDYAEKWGVPYPL